MQSIWQAEVKMPTFNSLKGHIHTDVAIVGGGIAGIFCAHELQCRGVDCILLEKDKICSATTGHTTGKITAGQGLVYQKIASRYGTDTAAAFYRANADAIKRLIALSDKYPCHMQIRDNYVYSLSDRAAIESEARILERLGAPVSFESTTELPFDVEGAARLSGQAQFNPLLMLGKMAEELEIYENSFVREIKGGRVYTDEGSVSAKSVIIATHFPFINSRGFYFLKLYQHRSYVLALENADSMSGMYVDEARGGLSFRNYGKYLLLGGGGHRTGKGGGCFDAVRAAKRRFYPDSAEKYAFAAQDCMSLDGMPYVGRYSALGCRLYVAGGFNKWGMCGSAVAAELLADMICGVQNDLSSVLSPSRSILHRQLLLNGIESAGGLLFPTTKRCAHLGCGLHWNRAEHSWDCACHGSRYTPDGRIIDNPTQKNAKL